MSYRLLKRVFGETKLELKLLLLFGVGLLTVIVASFWWYGSQTVELVYEQNRNTGRLVVEQIMLGNHLATDKVTTEEARKRPAMIEAPPEELAHQRQLNEELVDWLREGFSRQHEAMDLIWTYRTGDARTPLDGEERQVRDQFVQARREAQPGTGAAAEWKELRGAEEYRYFEAIRARDSCLRCHGVPPGGSGIDAAGSGVPLAGGSPVSLDDLMAVARVTIPNGPTQRRLERNSANLWATAILAVFLAMLTSYAIVRYVIVKPLGHLRDVSDAISRGNTALRAEIHTGDEFEGLAVAFNRMLRHLLAVQDELRQANTNLDSKVDELARANMRLYELNTLKSDFLATMSHELRTPLNSILGFSEVLGAIDALDEKQKRYVQNIEQSGRTLLDMINDILDLAKMESGKMEVRLTDFQVAQVVAAQCDMARPLAEKKNIDLVADIAADLPPVRQDQARVQQILNNLLSNAIKFTPEGGRVDLRVRRNDADDLLLEVSDTGVGIPEEEQQVIFEKFRQGRVGVDAGDAMTREYSGTGLGLSIVKELCKLLGGEISVASQLGKGSTFTVRLPWTLPEQARPGSPLIEGLDEFSKTRFEYGRP
jgi:signal transduction histidine kinase